MNETSHDLLTYEGGPGEPVTINVTPNGTTHLVTFNLNDVPHALPAGTPIRFNLGNSSGNVTRLQLIMDFNHEGSYEYEIENVVDCTEDTDHIGSCKHTREGPPLVIENFRFSVA
jgi:hypothetical protein